MAKAWNAWGIKFFYLWLSKDFIIINKIDAQLLQGQKKIKISYFKLKNSYFNTLAI